MNSLQPIGAVESPIQQPLRPAEMRGIAAVLALEPRFAGAAGRLRPGDYLWVIYHLHHIAPPAEPPADLFARRIPTRPNPLGMTLVQVLLVEGARITVHGLDAIDGTPILDLKPYSPRYDAPPVTSGGNDIPRGFSGWLRRAWFRLRLRTVQPAAAGKPPDRPVIVLTGGPGGGKSTLIEDLRKDPLWAGRFTCLPEAVQYARFCQVSPDEKLFQRMVVHLQIGLEDGMLRALEPAGPRLILCHRGSLDPLAFWRLRGWPGAEFYGYTGMTREEHYRRYAAVIHLVTAADDVPREYTRWPQAHRPEEPREAVQLDRWLEEAWSGHPAYYRLDNQDMDWPAKSRKAQEILEQVVKSGERNA